MTKNTAKTLAEHLDTMTVDAKQMQADGVDRMWSSVDLLLCDAHRAVTADAPHTGAAMARAARYIYGCLDSRYWAVVTAAVIWRRQMLIANS